MFKQITVTVFMTLLVLYIGVLVGLNMCNLSQTNSDAKVVHNNNEEVMM